MNLFDMTPEALQQQRAAALDTASQNYAKQDAQSRADAAGYQFGNIAARGLGSAMGVEDKELLKVRDIQGMMKGIDVNNPEALKQLSIALGQKGYMAEGEMAFKKYQEMLKANADVAGTEAKTTKDIALANAANARAERELKVAENAAKSEGFKNLPPEVQTILKLAEEDPSFDKVKAMKDYLAGKGKGEWSDPFNLGGATVQKNTKTNEIRTAVSRPPVTHINAGSGKPLSTNDIKEVNKLRTSVNNASANVDKADEYISGLEAGVAKFGATSNTASNLRTLFGSSTEGDRFKQNVEKYTTSSVNAVLNAAKGPQTDQDAERARQQILTGLQKNDTKSVLEGLKQLKKLHAEIYDNDSESLDLFSVERKRDLGPKKNTAKAGTKENPIKLD
jgi:hypothetical protein